MTGQDSSYLAEQLLANGVEVHGLVLPTVAPSRPLRGGVVAHKGDLADVEALHRLVRDRAPAAIFNLAGTSSVAQSWQEPGNTARLNGVTPMELLEAAYGAGTHREDSEVRAGLQCRDLRRGRDLAPGRNHAAHVYRHRGVHAVSCILYNHESPRRSVEFVTRKISHGVALITRGRLDRLTLGNLDARRDWGRAPDYVDAMVRAGHDQPQDYVVAIGIAHSVPTSSTRPSPGSGSAIGPTWSRSTGPGLAGRPGAAVRRCQPR